MKLIFSHLTNEHIVMYFRDMLQKSLMTYLADEMAIAPRSESVSQTDMEGKDVFQ